MTHSFTPGPVASALSSVVARAAALPSGAAERHVQICVRQVAASCLHRNGVRDAVDRFVAAITDLQGTLHDGPRRRAQHDGMAIERLLETFQEELLPELRRQGLL